jgi:hypothetical protein
LVTARSRQASEFLLTADEGGVEAAGESGRALNDFQEPISRNGIRLAFQRKRLGGADGHGVTNEPIRLLAEEDLAGPGGLLEAGGDVDGIAGGVEVAFGWVADDDFAGVDAGADGQRHTPLARELLVQVAETHAHVDGRPDGTEGVVFVRDRDPESGHDRIADELLNRAPVVLEDRAHLLEVAFHDAAEDFRVEFFPEPRGP